MRLALSFLALALAACADEPSPEEKAAADAAAVAEVEANQEAPPEAMVPQPILYPDVEKYGLFGAGCNFLPQGAGMGAVALAQADKGYMKRDGEVLTFAADKGSPNNPLGSWTKYDGKDYSFTLELEPGEGEQTGMETVDFDGELVVRDGKDRVIYQSAGIAQCGS